MERCDYRRPASASGLSLLLLLFVLGGCTTTDEVIASWRGQPIEAVVDQWGPPGTYESVGNGFGYAPSYEVHARTRAYEQPIRVGADTYTWDYTTHNFYPERCEVIETKDGCKTITTTRFIPAHWTVHAEHFYLRTDHAGRVVDGGSSYEHKIWPFNKLSENRRGWGSLRHGWDADVAHRLAVE